MLTLAHVLPEVVDQEDFSVEDALLTGVLTLVSLALESHEDRLQEKPEIQYQSRLFYIVNILSNPLSWLLHLACAGE